MKKISLALAFVMLICTFSFSAFAADDVATAVISSATAKAGEEVTLTVSIQNSPGITGAQLYIGYDSDALTYISATAANSIFYTDTSKAEGTNYIKVVMANFSMKNIEGEINIVKLNFKISDSAKSGKYDVSLSKVEAFDSDVAPVQIHNIENGVVTVKSSSSQSSETVHKHNYKTTVVAPLGTEPGYTLYECACGNSYNDDYVYDDSVSESKFEKVRTYDDSFVDVTDDKWFKDYVTLAYEYDLVEGTSATEFSPDNKFTVAQAVTAAAKIHTIYSGTTVRAVDEGEIWYIPYVEYCIENSIIKDGQFTDFDANITRGDMAIVFANILPESEYKAVRSVVYSDVIEESAIFPAYKLLYEAGIISGDAETGNYRPDDEIVRSEACVIFTRIAVVEQRAK